VTPEKELGNMSPPPKANQVAAPRLSNNDPCTSNCGKLILVAG
jgi:hypothetical protein